MASPAGNPNPSGLFFKPPTSPGPLPMSTGAGAGAASPSSPFPPPSFFAAPPPSFPGPPHPAADFYLPATAPFHHPFLHYSQDALQRPNLPPFSVPPPLHLLNPNPAPGGSPNPGARLMALLNPPANLETAVSMPSSAPSEFSVPPNPKMLHPVPSAPPAALPQPTPARLPSSKVPRGKLLGGGERAVYDVDARLPGEKQPPQLEVTPITKYTSDPGLVLGRQIAVNRTYICYGLKLGAIRVLNVDTALRSLLKGHTQVFVIFYLILVRFRGTGWLLNCSKPRQGNLMVVFLSYLGQTCPLLVDTWLLRVTDMGFFAEDVHLLASASIDGRIFVWKIEEGPDEENKPQITGNIIVAVQIVGNGELYNPRICWHSHKQEILFVGIGNRVLKLDITKVGRGKEISAEEPLKCPIEKLIDGVQLIGKHDAEVTDLSISQWITTRLASASKDGMVKIWDDWRVVALSSFKPHNGHPVNMVSFMTSPRRPDHINLITSGPLNREVKIWSSITEEGWLLPSDSESWQCIQTLDLRSSSEPQLDEAFFNQIVVLPIASLIVIANAKKNMIYAVHVDYGPCPASTHMDYIADFTVAMPILSLTGTTDTLPDGEQVVQVYCVQTQAIQQYALELTQCLPPPTANSGSGRDPIPHIFELSGSEEMNSLEHGSQVPAGHEFHTASASPKIKNSDGSMEGAPSMLGLASSLEVTDIHELPSTSVEIKLSAPPLPSIHMNAPDLATSSDTLNMDHAEKIPALRSPQNSSDLGAALDHDVEQSILDHGVDKNVDSGLTNASDAPANENSGPLSSDSSHVIQVVDERRTNQQNKLGPQEGSELHHADYKEISSQTSEGNHELVENERPTKTSTAGENHSGSDTTISESVKLLPTNAEEDIQDASKEVIDKGTKSAIAAASQFPPSGKHKKQKPKQIQASGTSTPVTSPFNSTDSLNEPGSSNSVPPSDAAFPQILAMHETLNQLMNMQKDMQKQMNYIVGAPVTKEGKRLETALGRNMEKAMKANVDALWARFQEENVKHERAEKERTQQLATLITNCMNKDMPPMLEKALKKEISSVGSIIARAISPLISSAVTESFQRGVGDKGVNQLEKSVISKLDASVTRQIQNQFQTSGKQALQEALRSSLESTVVPAFEQSCKAMFDQVDNVFQKGMNEHMSAAQQHLEAIHTPLALTLREAINSASSVTQNVSAELIDGQRKLLALVAAGNANSIHPVGLHQPNVGIPEMQVEVPMDPKKELARIISEHKYEVAFTMALQRSDVTLVSWLCAQVNVNALCSTVPRPLSQGVLLALLQQLACDINNETLTKVAWLTEVAIAIEPADPMIVSHVRPILEQVYSILAHQRSLPTTTPPEGNNMLVAMHVINSVRSHT